MQSIDSNLLLRRQGRSSMQSIDSNLLLRRQGTDERKVGWQKNVNKTVAFYALNFIVGKNNRTQLNNLDDIKNKEDEKLFLRHSAKIIIILEKICLTKNKSIF